MHTLETENASVGRIAGNQTSALAESREGVLGTPPPGPVSFISMVISGKYFTKFGYNFKNRIEIVDPVRLF